MKKKQNNPIIRGELYMMLFPSAVGEDLSTVMLPLHISVSFSVEHAQSTSSFVESTYHVILSFFVAAPRSKMSIDIVTT
jgi:hypothetical protein